MSEITFSPEEVERCKAAMAKPAPIEALRLIASGRVIVELTRDRRDVLIVELDKARVADPDHPNDLSRRCLLSGAWPLHRAGMIDQFGCVTDAGRQALCEGKAP